MSPSGRRKEIEDAESELEEWKTKLVTAVDHELKKMSLQNAQKIIQADEDMDTYRTKNDERIQSFVDNIALECSRRKGWEERLRRELEGQIEALRAQTARDLAKAKDSVNVLLHNIQISAAAADASQEEHHEDSSMRKSDLDTILAALKDMSDKKSKKKKKQDAAAADAIKELREELRRTNEEYQRRLSLHEAELLRMRQERDDDRRAANKVIERLEAQLNATDNNFAASQRSWKLERELP